MEKSRNKKTTQAGSQRNSASNHTLYTGSFNWVSSHNNNHVYFNEEWNGEYES